MKHNIFSAFCAILMTLFALSTFQPTDATAAVRSNTVKKSTSVGKKSKRSSRKSRRGRRHASKCTPANRTKGKQQALDLVRTQSQTLCKLTGLEYTSTSDVLDSARRLIAESSELTEEETDSILAASGDEALLQDEGEDLTELEQEDDVPVDIDTFRSLWLNYVDSDGDDLTEGGVEKSKIIGVVMDWLGTRYHFGGTSENGIDCSAFTRMLYATSAGIELPRTAAMQSTVGQPIRDIHKLQFGDLVFFHTRRHARVSHVGVYLGDNLFAHASSRYGVTISSLESTYYGKRFLGASRLQERDMVALAMPSAVSGD